MRAGLDVTLLINDLDSDPEIRQMIEDSENDIVLGKVYTSDEIIEAIKQGASVMKRNLK